MYTIGEFSLITKLTVKALRYYDEQGILVPDARDDNGYRLYSMQNYERAVLVSMLRQLDFGIAEIREILAHSEDNEDLQYYLAEKRNKIARNIQREKELMKQIEVYINPVEREERLMKYEMERRDIPEIKAALLSFEGTFQDIGAHAGELFKSVKGAASGPSFCLYHDAAVEEITGMDIGVPVKTPVEGGSVRTETMPAIQALCTTHAGSYETLNLAYKAVLDYARENGLKLLLPWREIYLKGPGPLFKGNPDKYRTEIQVPYAAE